MNSSRVWFAGYIAFTLFVGALLYVDQPRYVHVDWVNPYETAPQNMLVGGGHMQSFLYITRHEAVRILDCGVAIPNANYVIDISSGPCRVIYQRPQNG